VIAIRLLAEYFVKKIRRAVNYQVLFLEIRSGVHAAEHFDYA